MSAHDRGFSNDERVIFQCADVHKPLLSVSHVADLGYDCTMSRGGALSSSASESPDHAKNAVGGCEQLDHQASFTTLADLRHWMDTLSETGQRSPPVCRIRGALNVLVPDAS